MSEPVAVKPFLRQLPGAAKQHRVTKYERMKRKRLKALRMLLRMEAINPDDARHFLRGNKCYGKSPITLPPIHMPLVNW